MKCPYCEKEISETERFCPHCEGYVGNITNPPKNKTQTTRICPSCKKTVPSTVTYCPYCQKSVKGNTSQAFDLLHATPPVSAYAKKQDYSSYTNGYAIAGFILSFFFALLGLIFSIIGLRKSDQTGKGGGLAIAGLILSIINIVFTLIIYFALYDILKSYY